MKYTEGICGDGAVILCNGKEITINQILGRLNCLDEVMAENSKLEEKKETLIFAIEQIHDIAREYFSDTCGECEEAGRILSIIGDLRSSI